MPRKGRILPKLETHNIEYLREKLRLYQLAWEKIKGRPVNVKVRNAIIDAGVPAELVSLIQTTDVAMKVLRHHWLSVKEIFEHNFDKQNVARVFRELEREERK